MAAGVWRGKVTRIDAGGRPYVRVRGLNRRHVFGPLPRLEQLDTLAGAVTGLAGTDPHQHATVDPAVVPLAEGDDVLVAFIEGRPDDLIVLGRIR